MDEVSRARRSLFLFFAFVVVGSGVLETLIIRTGDPIETHPFLVVANMWVPGLAAVATRLCLREGFHDVSFRFGGAHGWRMLFFGWFYPLAVGLIAYGGAWLSGLETFAAPPSGWSLRFATGALPRFVISIPLTLTLGTVISSISALGEEIGWRGFMLLRLKQAGVSKPLLTSGLIWSLWHVPMIVSGQYASGPLPILSALLFVVCTTADGAIIGRLRLQSGSLWPAVVAHASWNAIIQGVFDRFTVGGGASHTTSIWIGESGILVTAVDVLIAVWLFRTPMLARVTPDETLITEP